MEVTEMEIDLTGVDPLTFPETATWEWHIALYLFIGGLVAGVMVIGAILRLRKADGYDRGLRIVEMASLPLIAVGLLLLFLDLGNGWNSWRFYTTFQPTSAMSWGSWILLFVGIVLAIRVARHIADAGWRPKGRLAGVARMIERIGALARARWMDVVFAVLGLGLGVYTGVLLSTIPARPLWNSPVLPVLFLVSGIAVGGAFLCLFLEEEPHLRLVPVVIALCATELAAIGGLVWWLSAGSEATADAAGLLTGGGYALALWGGVVVFGLLIPVSIEVAEWMRRSVPAVLSRIAPYLKLGGGVVLRFVIVYAGLQSAI
jgi:formate-dependent nitrite reductase membrane component NrfD